MIISHYGLGMVKIQQGDWVVAFNPIGKGADQEVVKFGADLALVSLSDAGYAGVEQVSRADRVPFVIDGPGEYEVEGNLIRGFATIGPGQKINTVYLLQLEGARLVHLGALAEAELSNETVEALGTIDILFAPLAEPAEGGLGPKGAAKLATKLEPRVIVPVNFSSSSLALFLKEMGEEKLEAVESWTVKKKELSEKAGDVVVIKSF
ncbi:MAG: MBL fold metallo-hydrolase [Patescibacteria group bacterium]